MPGYQGGCCKSRPQPEADDEPHCGWDHREHLSARANAQPRFRLGVGRPCAAVGLAPQEVQAGALLQQGDREGRRQEPLRGRPFGCSGSVGAWRSTQALGGRHR